MVRKISFKIVMTTAVGTSQSNPENGNDKLKELYESLQNFFEGFSGYEANKKDQMIHVIESAIWHIVNSDGPKIEELHVKLPDMKESIDDVISDVNKIELKNLSENQRLQVTEISDDDMTKFNKKFQETFKDNETQRPCDIVEILIIIGHCNIM